jgi:hypothetical protein
MRSQLHRRTRSMHRRWGADLPMLWLGIVAEREKPARLAKAITPSGKARPPVKPLSFGPSDPAVRRTRNQPSDVADHSHWLSSYETVSLAHFPRRSVGQFVSKPPNRRNLEIEDVTSGQRRCLDRRPSSSSREDSEATSRARLIQLRG